MGGSVTPGIYGAYTTMEDDMMQLVSDLISTMPDVAGILITGHSFGATASFFGADDLAAAHPDLKVTLYNYGSFRPGNKAFADRLATTSNLDVFTVVWRADDVPQDYPRILGFHNVPTVLWFPEDLANTTSPEGWIVCDGGEDPDCQNRLSSDVLTHYDHDFYLNHEIWCCGDNTTKETGPDDDCKYPPFDSSLRLAASLSVP